MRPLIIRLLFFILSLFISMLVSGPIFVLAAEPPLSAQNPGSPPETNRVQESDDYATPPVWRATGNTFLDGRLIYKDMNAWIAPGMNDTTGASWDLTKSAGRDYRDTVVKLPDTFETIYDSGLVQNYMEYRIMAGKNWQFAKLSADDFADAGHIYATEGNWGLLQTGYYCLKGTSRVVWALAILNSGEAVWKIVQAGGETVYYLLRYPVGGVLKTGAVPVVLAGGTAWSTVASVVTTGWALPFTAVYDAFRFAGGLVWSE